MKPADYLSKMGALPNYSSRQLFRLALPIVVVNLGQMLMGVVDTLMVGRISKEAIAAVALGNFYFFAVAITSEGILLALDPVISQAVGAGDQATAGRSAQRGIIMAGLLTIPSAAILGLAGPVFGLLRQPVEIIPIASRYTLLIIPGMLPFLGFVVLRQTLQAMSRIRPIIVTIVIGNLANLLLNWILIFGKLGAPRLGVNGSAMATSLSRWLLALTLLGASWPVLRPMLGSWYREVWSFAALWRLVVIGLPISGQRQLEYLAFGATALAMGWIGTDALAGHQIALTLAALAYMVPLGVGAAGSVLVGYAIGAERHQEAADYAFLALKGGAAAMAGAALIFVLFPEGLARFYTADASVIKVAAGLLPLAGAFAVFDGLQAVGLGVLRGAADTKVPMLINLVGYWILGLPIGLLLAFQAGWGARGLWVGLVIGLGVVALLLLGRVRAHFNRPLTRVWVESE